MPFIVRHMSERSIVNHTLSGPEQTRALARAMAPGLKPGDVILLSGEIGAGKTHFARCLIQVLLTTPEDVPSPTFTLIQTYDGQSGEIWHADLYRLGHVDEVEELGLLDAFETGICLVEWPDRLGEEAPSSALSMTFAMTEVIGERKLELSWSDPRWDVMQDLDIS